MNPYLLEDLFQRLGEPWWFWPAVLALILLLIGLGSNPVDFQ